MYGKSISLIIHIFLLLGLISFTKPAQASHIGGGDFNYQCIGPNTYMVTLNLYRDCDGIGMGILQYQTINFTSTCGQTLAVHFPLQNVPLGTEISQLCSSSIVNSTCNGGNLPGMQQYTYSGIVVLDPPCNDWTMSWTSCCRNADIQNIVNPASSSLWVPATLNSASDSCNNSPVFNAQPIPYVCQNQPVNYNFGVSEPDGDSLVYSLVSPIASSNNGVHTNITWNTGYSSTQPIPGCILNPNTGQLTFTPTQLDNFVVAVQVCEYEPGTGVLKGCITRDIQFVVISCSNQQPVLSGISNFSGTGTLVDSTTIAVCVGDSISFDIQYSDPNMGDTVSLTSNLTSVLPGANVTYTNGNPGIMNVTYTIPPGTSPFNSFSVQGIDNACPIYGVVSGAYVIKASPSTYAGPDQAICQGAEWAQLNATGGTSFNWSVHSGSPIDTVPTSPGFNMTCINCPNPKVSPQTTSTYIVQSNDTSLCYHTDTITITAAPNYTAHAGPDTTVCSVNSMQLYCGASIGGNFTYRWSPTTRVSNDTIQNPFTSTSSTTTYTVTMTSADGCVKTASNTIGKVPLVSISALDAIDPNICQFGDSSNLSVSLAPEYTGSCVGSPTPCGNQTYTADIMLDYDIATGIAGPIDTLANNEYPAPFGNAFKSVKQVYLYRASELHAMGLQAGLITELGFFVTAINGTSTYHNYSLSIGCTQYRSLPSTIFPIGFTNVFPAQNINISTGWNMLPFSTPYIWDGSSNIMVEICFDNRSQGATQNTSTRTREFKPNTPGNQQYVTSLVLPIDTANACLGQLGSEAHFTRPDTRFTFCSSAPPAVYNYTWWPNHNITDTTIHNPTIWPDTTTTYNVIVSDTFGVCADTASIEITVTYFDVGPDTLICIGDTIRLDPEIFDNFNTFPRPTAIWSSSTGTGFINFSYNPNNIIVPTISVDTTTTFYATYTNSYGCVVEDSITIYVSKMDEPNLVFTEPACGLTDGQILVNSNGGSVPFTFSSDGGQTFHIDSLFTNLAMGSYSSQYMDSNGCLSPMRTDTLINFNTPNIDSIVSTPLCFSIINGTIDIYISGGQPPHSYSIDGGVSWQPNSSYTNVTAGTYVIYAQDANGCVSWPDTVKLLNNSQLLLDSIQYTDLICFNDSSGAITAFGHGGTPPYSYSIDNGVTYQVSSFFDILHADTYQVVIMDSMGCTSASIQQIITQGVEITGSVTTVNDTCYNLCQGNAVFNLLTGSSPITYQWFLNGNVIDTGSTATNLCINSNYYVLISDSNNCNERFDFSILGPPPFTVSTTTTHNSCYNSNDGQLIITPNGGTSPFQYSIDNGTTFSNDSIFSMLPAQIYQVVISESNSYCTATSVTQITEPNEILINANHSSTQICFGECITLNATITGGSGPPYTYNWNQGLSNLDSHIVCPKLTTLYTIYGMDTTGCSSDTLQINVHAYDSLTVDAGPDETIVQGESVLLHAIVNGGDGNYVFLWSPSQPLDNELIANPVALPGSTTVFVVEVSDNCNSHIATDSLLVNVIPTGIEDLSHSNQFIATPSFTPNGDGVSDYFQINSIHENSIRFYYTIYDLSGKSIFTSNNLDDLWDGSSKNNGSKASSGMYLWIIYSKTNSNQVIQSGKVNLIR